jgi:hypothetical protein
MTRASVLSLPVSLAFPVVLACSASGASPSLVVGNDGSGGATGQGGNGTILVQDAGRATAFSAHVESPRGMTVSFVTLSCSKKCADVLAVATGGVGPYSYRWEDGSTDAARRVCSTSTTRYSVTATDSASSGEFGGAAETARATLTANVISCPDAGPSDGGSEFTPDAGSPVELEPATEFHWAHWTTMTAGNPGTVAGTLLPPSGAITVTYSGEVYSALLPGLPGTQTTTGTNYFTPASTYTSATVGNSPLLPGIVMQQGGTQLVDSLTFSRPVTNPVLAIMSLGDSQTGVAGLFQFSAFAEPFTVLKQGPGAQAGPGTLSNVNGDLHGDDGDGLVQFNGTFTTIKWTDPNGEWPGQHGVTVGIGM